MYSLRQVQSQQASRAHRQVREYERIRAERDQIIEQYNNLSDAYAELRRASERESNDLRKRLRQYETRFVNWSYVKHRTSALRDTLARIVQWFLTRSRVHPGTVPRECPICCQERTLKKLPCHDTHMACDDCLFQSFTSYSNWHGAEGYAHVAPRVPVCHQCRSEMPIQRTISEYTIREFICHLPLA